MIQAPAMSHVDTPAGVLGIVGSVGIVGPVDIVGSVGIVGIVGVGVGSWPR